MYATMSDVISRSPAALDLWVHSGSKIEVTHTYYDIPGYYPSPGFTQQNLRSRVTSVTFEAVDDADSLTYNSATHYTYDISGNVSALIQENTLLEGIGRSLKRIDYDYDLVSGKVNYVNYQKDSVDQFIHHYEYDDDNRITHVYTSRDGMLWDEDAQYKYYLHGPLARVELGQQKVQGVDYAYTLQGWMKGINASTIDTVRGMGNDGTWPATGFSRDAYGFSLGYFYQDYKQIDPSNNFQADYTADGSGSTFGTASFGSTTNLGLYNGNIRHSVLSMDSMNYPNIGYVYQYDQLNRLKEMNAYAGLVTDSNDWTTDPVLDDYKELVDFDPNGNILKYLRRGTTTGGNPLDMDSMTYNYTSGKNQLEYVTDNIADGNYSNDIDDQSAANYIYDANGNLIQDNAEGITMTWWNNGKLQSVKKASGDSLGFAYDPTGNRIMKAFYNDATDDSLYTMYVRDAQGNIMATYEWKNEDTLRLVELDIYGSSRVGLVNEDSLVGCVGCTTATSSGSASLWTGKKMYELTNHLGNVLSTITDKKIYYDADLDSSADYSIPEIASQQDYYPFGMPMPGRSLSLSNYRFGFNSGSEKIDEIYGKGNHYFTEWRELDVRLGGRWWSSDPIVKPWESPYVGFGNNPIYFSDPMGLDSQDPPSANPKTDSKGSAGSTAPNGGTHENEGGVTGGAGFCKGCGEHGEDIYGIPKDKSVENNSKPQPPPSAANKIEDKSDNSDNSHENHNAFSSGSHGAHKVAGAAEAVTLSVDAFLNHSRFRAIGFSTTRLIPPRLYGFGPSGRVFTGNQSFKVFQFNSVKNVAHEVGLWANLFAAGLDAVNPQIGNSELGYSWTKTGVAISNPAFGFGIFIFDQTQYGDEMRHAFRALDILNKQKEWSDIMKKLDSYEFRQGH